MLWSNWPLKLTSIFLALVLWLVAVSEEPSSRFLAVNVAVTAPLGRTASWTPDTVQVLFVGPGRELLKLAASRITVARSVPDTVSGQRLTLELSPADLEIPRNINVRVQDFEPRRIAVELDSVIRKTVPVHADVRADGDSGYVMVGGVQVVPGAVSLSGPFDFVQRIDSVSTLPLRLTGADGPVERELSIDTVGFGPLRVAPAEVTVSLDIERVTIRAFESVPVELPGELAGTHSIQPESVRVRLRGPVERMARVTPESIHVFIDPAGPGAGRVPLRIMLPPGISGSLHPDTVTLAKRRKP